MLLLAACGTSGTAGAPAMPATPKATATPTATPTAVPNAPPVVLTGTGSKVTDPVELQHGLYRVAWSAQGTSNFVVTIRGTSADASAVLVNVILPNPSSGEAPFDALGGRYVFAIQADQASWNITLTRVAP